MSNTAALENQLTAETVADEKIWDLLVVGGGPAGLAAAISAYDAGAKEVLVVEREKELGGILNQCVHNGFGLRRFNEELTGPEYAGRFIDELQKRDIKIALEATCLGVEEEPQGSPAPLAAKIVSSTLGFRKILTKTAILSTGCRERTRGAIGTPGDRPSGVFTAGAAQRYVNREGEQVGKRVVILGSGDIGLIMARRLTLEGAKVLAVVELMPYSNGLARNIAQCLNDFNIPLYLAHTIVKVVGKGRLSKVIIAKVDEKRAPIPGTEIEIECDTLLLSVGLIPENEVARTAGVELDPRTRGPIVTQNRETSIPGVFSCGNALHVHDLVDFVSEEAEEAGKAAAARALGRSQAENTIAARNGALINYVVPQKIDLENAPEKIAFFMRVAGVFTNKRLVARNGQDGDIVKAIKRLRVAPAEMERVEIPVEALKDCKELVFSLED